MQIKIRTLAKLKSFLFLIFLPFVCFAGNPPDSTQNGPHSFASSEYHLPASVDPDVLSDRMTELWAKVFYPTDIKNAKAPLIVMLHGNHATCGKGANPRNDTSCAYTDTGTCPAGYIVVPNHEGYNYLAENLASWGFYVVSINANRGITCGGGTAGDDGLNLARGRLVLKHLSMLYQWATKGGAPNSLGFGPNGLIDKIDFKSVGLFGHSRGGEGIRAAYNLYRDEGSSWPEKIPGLTIKAMFEVGAVDGQTSRTLDADGTIWNQLLPMCDGDVSDLEGRYPYERMLLNKSEKKNAQKSLYEVWGANHNFFNTEWQESDSYGCKMGNSIFDPKGWYSEAQQKVALASVPAFFRSRMGVDKEDKDPLFNQNFNPLDQLGNVVTAVTEIDRDFTPSPNKNETFVVDDFDQTTGKNSSGNNNLANGISIDHYNYDRYHVQRVASINWESAGKNTYFEAVWAKEKQGRNIQGDATLDFRIARKDDKLNVEPTTDFSIQLEDADGKFSNQVLISHYGIINGPGNTNLVLKSIRIPLTAFENIDFKKIHGVRFIFNQTETGWIYLANIRIQRQLGFGQTGTTTQFRNVNSKTYVKQNPIAPIIVVEKLNSIQSIKMIKAVNALGKSKVEITVQSKVHFPAMNHLPILQIGNKKFTLSRYADMNQLKALTFTITEDDYKTLAKTDDITVINGKIWKLGQLGKWDKEIIK